MLLRFLLGYRRRLSHGPVAKAWFHPCAQAVQAARHIFEKSKQALFEAVPLSTTLGHSVKGGIRKRPRNRPVELCELW